MYLVYLEQLEKDKQGKTTLVLCNNIIQMTKLIESTTLENAKCKYLSSRLVTNGDFKLAKECFTAKNNFTKVVEKISENDEPELIASLRSAIEIAKINFLSSINIIDKEISLVLL